MSLTAGIITEITENGGLTDNQLSFIETAIENLQLTLRQLDDQMNFPEPFDVKAIEARDNEHDKLFRTIAKASKDILVLSKQF